MNYKNKKWLYEKYWIEGFSLREIAQVNNVSKSTIVGFMIKFSIDRDQNRSSKKRKKYNFSFEELYDLYILQEKSSIEIAKIYNTDSSVILRHLKKYNIKTRTGKDKFTKQSKEKISISSKVAMPKHVKDALYKANFGRKQTREEIEKRANTLRGNKNPLWKGSRPLIEKIRKCNKYVWWRKSVFERDQYRCVFCGDDKGGNLNADHIKPFSYMINSNNIRTLNEALQCDILWDINNGRTLCVECHKKTDTYGELAKRFLKKDLQNEQ